MVSNLKLMCIFRAVWPSVQPDQSLSSVAAKHENIFIRKAKSQIRFG